MPELHFINSIHSVTPRDYLARVRTGNKLEYSLRARQFGEDYWDGSRDTGYGGYRYDGRWRPFAEKIASYYQLKKGHRVLDVGCGKGYLLFELITIVPGLIVEGLDISKYALRNSKIEVKPYLKYGKAENLEKFRKKSYDLVISINTLHNLNLPNLLKSIKYIQRITKRKSYIVVDSYRNVAEMLNLMNWQLTCNCFFSTQEWQTIFKLTGYKGDYDYVFFK